MNAPGPSQSPVAKAGWLIALIFVGWLAFLFIPVPKPDPKAAPPYVKPPPSRLVALGLPDNPDLEHLPEFFALYADKAEWKDNKTIFAYWNPGSNSYSYFVEAIRAKEAFRFRMVPEPHLATYGPDENMPEDCPIRLYRSMDRSSKNIPIPQIQIQSSTCSVPLVPERAKSPEPSKIPPPELKFPPLDLEQKK